MAIERVLRRSCLLPQKTYAFVLRSSIFGVVLSLPLDVSPPYSGHFEAGINTARLPGIGPLLRPVHNQRRLKMKGGQSRLPPPTQGRENKEHHRADAVHYIEREHVAGDNKCSTRGWMTIVSCPRTVHACNFRQHRPCKTQRPTTMRPSLDAKLSPCVPCLGKLGRGCSTPTCMRSVKREAVVNRYIRGGVVESIR